ncbi:MAG: HDIG domain-containing protein [Dehalococcoidia bacterium]|nr:MAG: HDIG domain-containing protein [Dehalococcoidia bacterium]
MAVRAPRPVPARPMRRRSWWFGVAVTLLLTAALFPVYPGVRPLREGSIVARALPAPRDLSYESEVRTRAVRKQAADAVPEVVVLDTTVRDRQLADLERVLREVDRVRHDAGLSASAKESALRAIPGTTISQEGATALAALTSERWEALTAELRAVLGRTLVGAVAAHEVEQAKTRAAGFFSPSLSELERAAARELLSPLIITTLKVDAARTEAQRKQARDNTPPVVVSFTRGQPVVDTGDLVDAAAIEALDRLGVNDGALRWPVVAAAVVAAMVSGAACAVVAEGVPSLAGARRRLLFALLLAVAVFAAKSAAPFLLLDDQRRFLVLALPLCAVPVAATLLLDAGAGLLLAALLGALTAFAGVAAPSATLGEANALEVAQFAAAATVGSLAAVGVATRSDRGQRIVFAGLAAAAGSGVTAGALLLLDPDRRLEDLPWLVGASVVGGLWTAVLAALALALLGKMFGIVTRVQLMELGQLSHPLLRRLQDEAPGTFQHAMLVGNLAERAADRIGADALLVRVGAYYHDVGKLYSPAFFVENFGDDPSPHEHIDPMQSNRVILQHVTQGVELARKEKIPEVVVRFIPEHHGTRLVTYFYRRAAEVRPDVSPDLFRYPGPKPQTRETALVMIADACEATVRSMPDRSTERIREAVEQTIRERIEEGQLDECPISLRDLRVVADTYTATLNAVFHPRVEYPEPTRRELAARGAALPAPQRPETPQEVIVADLPIPPRPAISEDDTR